MCQIKSECMATWSQMLSASVQCVGALTLISAGVILLLVGRCLTVAAL